MFMYVGSHSLFQRHAAKTRLLFGGWMIWGDNTQGCSWLVQMLPLRVQVMRAQLSSH